MACQKVCKQGRDDDSEGKFTKPYPYIFLHTLQLQTNVKTMQGWGFVNLPSLLYHPYLVCIVFGIPSLHPFIFLMLFKSCIAIALGDTSKLFLKD